MTRTYSKATLGTIIGDEWALLGDAIDTSREDGLFLVNPGNPESIYRHSAGGEAILPFPFTLAEFKAFCAWHPTFAWEAVIGPFTNEPNKVSGATIYQLGVDRFSLDDDALEWLHQGGADAEELVRFYLTNKTPFESIEERNSQWLEIFDEELAVAERGAQARAIKRIQGSGEFKRDMIKKALTKAMAEREEAIREGSAKPAWNAFQMNASRKKGRY